MSEGLTDFMAVRLSPADLVRLRSLARGAGVSKGRVIRSSLRLTSPAALAASIQGGGDEVTTATVEASLAEAEKRLVKIEEGLVLIAKAISGGDKADPRLLALAAGRWGADEDGLGRAMTKRRRAAGLPD